MLCKLVLAFNLNLAFTIAHLLICYIEREEEQIAPFCVLPAGTGMCEILHTCVCVCVSMSASHTLYYSTPPYEQYVPIIFQPSSVISFC